MTSRGRACVLCGPAPVLGGTLGLTWGPASGKTLAAEQVALALEDDGVGEPLEDFLFLMKNTAYPRLN